MGRLQDFFELKVLKPVLDQTQYEREYWVNTKIGTFRLDFYIPSLNVAIEFDEKHHYRQNEADFSRQRGIQNKLGCIFIRIGEELSEDLARILLTNELSRVKSVKIVHEEEIRVVKRTRIVYDDDVVHVRNLSNKGIKPSSWRKDIDKPFKPSLKR